MLTTSWRRLVAVVGVVFVSALVPSIVPARADISSCGVETDVHQVQVNSQTAVTFTVTNTDANDIVWMRPIVPTGDYQIASVTVSGWDYNISPGSTSAFLTGGVLPSGSSMSMVVLTQSSTSPVGTADWILNVSDNASGANAMACDGNRSLETIGAPVVPLQITNVEVTGIGTTGVTVRWETNKPATSQVQYGADTSYGASSVLDSNLVNTHGLALGGLSPGSVYHFIVLSGTPSDGLVASSGDSTFVTADAQVITKEVAGRPVVQIVNVPGAVILQSPQEAVKPVVSLVPLDGKPSPRAPLVRGEASDNAGVARIEFSSDGGTNWLPVDSVVPVKGAGARRVGFSFTPELSVDGDYRLVVRAIDTSLNVGVSASVTVVIDRLPPRFASNVVQIGTQMIRPLADGTLVVPEGVDLVFVTKMVGGPTSARLEAVQAGELKHQSFSLRPQGDEGLWRGTLSFAKPGRVVLGGAAVDGAGNTTQREILTLNVVPALHILGASKQTQVIVYRWDDDGLGWKAWDGAAYGVDNPQALSDDGKVRALVPGGRYYLKVERPGAFDVVTAEFNLDAPTPLTGTIDVGLPAHIRLGSLKVPLPWPALAAAPVAAAGSVPALAPRVLPLKAFPRADSGTTNVTDWYGRPTVIATVATWNPVAVDGLSALEEVAKNADVGVIVLAQGERPETLAAFLARAGSPLRGVADPDAELSVALGVPYTPGIYLLDRHGTVVSLYMGELDAATILTRLGSPGSRK